MYKFDFNKTEYEFFLDNCPFSDEEEKIFELRRRGKSVCSMTFTMNMSERTIKRRISSINKKILRAISPSLIIFL